MRPGNFHDRKLNVSCNVLEDNYAEDIQIS